MVETDFITALGRLLHDAPLRAAFAQDPRSVAAQLNLRAHERGAFVDLVSADLEFQARILLHKRFDRVCRELPATSARLGGHAWLAFQAFSARAPDADTQDISTEAAAFCRHVFATTPHAVCRAELARARFAPSHRRIALHLSLKLPSARGPQPGLQLLFRTREGRVREWRFYLAI